MEAHRPQAVTDMLHVNYHLRDVTCRPEFWFLLTRSTSVSTWQSLSGADMRSLAGTGPTSPGLCKALPGGSAGFCYSLGVC